MFVSRASCKFSDRLAFFLPKTVPETSWTVGNVNFPAFAQKGKKNKNVFSQSCGPPGPRRGHSKICEEKECV